MINEYELVNHYYSFIISDHILSVSKEIKNMIKMFITIAFFDVIFVCGLLKYLCSETNYPLSTSMDCSFL
jgi:hypothetical protein